MRPFALGMCETFFRHHVCLSITINHTNNDLNACVNAFKYIYIYTHHIVKCLMQYYTLI